MKAGLCDRIGLEQETKQLPMKFTYKYLTLKCDHLKQLKTLTSDYIKRLSL